MFSSRIQLNPRFADFQDTLAKHPEWLKAWSGNFFRFQTIDFPGAKDVLSGAGARHWGGRWNRPGIAAVYGSTTDTTALEECKANDRYYGVESKSARLLVAIEAQLTRALDLTDSGIRRTLGITLEELAVEDWRKLSRVGQESLSQALGRAAAISGASGLLTRSAGIRLGVNVVVFPRSNRHDRMAIVEGEKLARLGVRLQA
jgi:RES domain-containing protein